MSTYRADHTGSKRGRSRSRSNSPPWKRSEKIPRRDDRRQWNNDNARSSQWGRRDQNELNQLQEDEQVRQWVAQEDVFVLKQAKKRAEIRVKEGRAKPIDWLAVILRVIDPTRNALDDEISDSDLDLIDPEGVFEGLSQAQLAELEKDFDTFLTLEESEKNRDFWKVSRKETYERQKVNQEVDYESRLS